MARLCPFALIPGPRAGPRSALPHILRGLKGCRRPFASCELAWRWTIIDGYGWRDDSSGTGVTPGSRRPARRISPTRGRPAPSARSMRCEVACAGLRCWPGTATGFEGTAAPSSR